MLTSVSPHKALEYFESKLEFTLGPMDLKELLKSRDLVIVDVREEKDFKQGHIPGAINLPQSSWGRFEGLSREKTNIVYCYSITCYLATRACKEFAENEFPVMELIGGFEEWKNHKMPIEK